MLTSGFKEQHEKRLKIPASSDTVTEFIKFFYGFDLEQDLKFETVRELIKIGGVYDETVQNAAGELIGNHLTKENVFEILQFCKTFDAKIGKRKCLKFIIDSFDTEHLMDNNYLDKHPEIAVDILKNNQREEKNFSIVTTHDKVQKVR